MTTPQWLDADSAARYLSLRLDAFNRKVRAGVIPAANYSLGERTPRWLASDLDTMMRPDTGSTDPRTAVQALVEKIQAQGQSRARRQANPR
jgi:hypothetical protein